MWKLALRGHDSNQNQALYKRKIILLSKLICKWSQCLQNTGIVVISLLKRPSSSITRRNTVAEGHCDRCMSHWGKPELSLKWMAQALKSGAWQDEMVFTPYPFIHACYLLSLIQFSTFLRVSYRYMIKYDHFPPPTLFSSSYIPLSKPHSQICIFLLLLLRLISVLHVR